MLALKVLPDLSPVGILWQCSLKPGLDDLGSRLPMAANPQNKNAKREDAMIKPHCCANQSRMRCKPFLISSAEVA